MDFMTFHNTQLYLTFIRSLSQLSPPPTIHMAKFRFHMWGKHVIHYRSYPIILPHSPLSLPLVIFLPTYHPFTFISYIHNI